MSITLQMLLKLEFDYINLITVQLQLHKSYIILYNACGYVNAYVARFSGFLGFVFCFSLCLCR